MELAAVIDRAVAWEPAGRYRTMDEAKDALAEAARIAAVPRTTTHAAVAARRLQAPDAAVAALSADEALGLAREVGDALCAEGEEHGGGLRWKRHFEWTEDTEYSPDLYGGAAGVGLFLADLARVTGEERYAAAARGAARWLTGPVWGRGRAQHGLHDGEAGIAFFLVRLASLLDAPGYLAAAEMRLRRLRHAAPRTIDLLYGTAGTLLGTLALSEAIGDLPLLAEARAMGDQLVDSALSAPAGAAGCFWEVASSAPVGPTKPMLGLLHGAAGIGLALAHLARVSGDQRYLDGARASAALLLSQASVASALVPAVGGATKARTMTWPLHLGHDKPGLQAQCHGAGGIGYFFLQLDRIAPDPRYRDAAEGAAYAVVAQLEAETRSGICHGLSGTAHLAIDCFQSFEDLQWIDFAHRCARRLQRFRVAGRPGVYAMHGQAIASPDLMLGYAGVGSVLLRLVHPNQTPDPILGHLTSPSRKG